MANMYIEMPAMSDRHAREHNQPHHQANSSINRQPRLHQIQASMQSF